MLEPRSTGLVASLLVDEADDASLLWFTLSVDPAVADAAVAGNASRLQGLVLLWEDRKGGMVATAVTKCSCIVGLSFFVDNVGCCENTSCPQQSTTALFAGVQKRRVSCFRRTPSINMWRVLIPPCDRKIMPPLEFGPTSQSRSTD